MIDDMDRSLEALLLLELGTPLPFDLSFAVPDRDFTPVSAVRSTLNCYLYDIREQRDLRDPVPRMRREPGGGFVRETSPSRITLSYCITAWSPAGVTPAIAQHLDEHNLLGAVLRALLRNPELPTAALKGALAGQPVPVPTLVARPDAARDVGDFWNAIGGKLRPSVELAVTISLAFGADERGSLVTSIEARVGDRATPRGYDSSLVVAGTVWDAAVPRRPVPGAWVRVDQTGETQVADEGGHFVLGRIGGGSYTLRTRAVGFREATSTVTAPPHVGSYDVVLDPL